MQEKQDAKEHGRQHSNRPSAAQDANTWPEAHMLAGLGPSSLANKLLSASPNEAMILGCPCGRRPLLQPWMLAIGGAAGTEGQSHLPLISSLHRATF